MPLDRRRPTPALWRVALLIGVLAVPIPAGAQTATETPDAGPSETATPPPSPTASATASLTHTAGPSPTRTRTGTRTATPTPVATATRTNAPTRTAIATRTRTATASSTPLDTATRTASPTRTASATRTGTRTRTSTPVATATHTATGTRTFTGTRTPMPTRTVTGSPTATGTATRTPTPFAAFISVDLVADKRGDNGDGTFTTVVSALLSDPRGNPVGAGVTVIFSLAPPLSGVTINQTGETNAPPDCDVSAYVADTDQELDPQPGVALTCLNYVESRSGQLVTVLAQVAGPNGLVESQREIRLPAGPPPTATVTETFTPSPSATASGSATRTGTVTETPSVTLTPTEAPTETPTATPLLPLRLAVLAGAARPGSDALIRFELADGEERVHGIIFDVLIISAAFEVFNVPARCQRGPEITSHTLVASLTQEGVIPIGRRKLRFSLADLTNRRLPPGIIVECRLPVADDAPIGASPLILDRILPGDANGLPIAGILPVNDVLVVDPDAPLPTATGTATSTPSATRTRTASATPSVTATASASATASATATASDTPTASATATPPPTETPTAVPTETPTVTPTPSPSVTPTPTPIPCTGDCDGSGAISIDELIRAVGISLGAMPVSACSAVDRDGSADVTIDELIAAVRNALDGC